jgi:ribosomal protein RSM22 (predicted rRNA methylase)
MELPQTLRDALDREISGGAALERDAQALSLRYRERTQAHGSFLTGGQDAEAYAVSRLPATFAAVSAAIAQAVQCLPDFQPRTLLDAGCGPGTALWAAAQAWPQMQRMTALERDGGMRALAVRLAGHTQQPALRQADILPADLTGPWDAPASDLVTACYVLGELEPKQADALTLRLWEHAEGTLLLVEPGTKAGFATILRARDMLRELGAAIAAPCPHGDACPLEDDWCHFSQRVARNRAHRQAKGGVLGYEDEKYSYICATRLNPAPSARVLRHPQVRKGHLQFMVCTAEGIQEVTLSKKDGEAYKRAKNLKWGDGF